MAIVTISRGSYTKGKEIAEKVAQMLGYACFSRDVILEASEHFNVPEIKLVRSIQDAHSILERFTQGKKEKYIAFISSALLKHFKNDNVVYHGIAGNFFLKEVPHVLKVRVIADWEQRVRAEMEREKISYDEALNVLHKDDEERKKWSKALYGIDIGDPSLYDLVIYIKKITVDDAVNMICETVKLKQFQTTPESQSQLDDLLLCSQVYGVLIPLMSNVSVSAEKGIVTIACSSPGIMREELFNDIRRIAMGVPGVKDVLIEV